MIRLKNEKQIDEIRKSCQMLSAMYKELIPLVQPGVTTLELDLWAQDWIKKAGGKPAFLGYGDRSNPFPGALCISINEEVIHGIPSKRKIADGDLVSIDSGIDLGGYISDRAVTVEAGTVSEAAHKLNTVTRECLYKGIEAAKAGDRLLQISRAVYNHAASGGYGVVHQYCGHGVGFDVHEDPQVPNYPHGPNPRMVQGLVIAIEPMINLGTGDVELMDDDWTVVTADSKLSAHWEHTIAVFKDHTEILTE
ncbi:type I methionyl aminopeptidase [Breznakiella homolactica]|uniref:Methionine aminopeptidase n=1 Tax=Breznakiella homolactica TaxID=2798577 RepID=A0A7T7XRN5_9SPIR|nr:type I methionyl aminopeptidase [Breznakiella homolactica]QQO11236.1 type I methionyl aminopeptidase [Breznakiella homolactica]